MHRSATSLTTSVLVGVGWTTSARPLIGATPTQRRGHFEDRAIQRLHEDLLRANDLGWDAWAGLRTLRGTRLSLGTHAASLDGVVDELRDGEPWVWKNPRASLFVAEWAARLPEAHFVFCVRNPAEVADSLLRRRNRLRIAGRGRRASLKRVVAAVSLWRSYSLPVYRFARAHPDRVTVMLAPDDLPALAAATEPSLFEPNLMVRDARWEVRLLAALNLPAQLLYRRIRRLHRREQLQVVLGGPDSTTA